MSDFYGAFEAAKRNDGGQCLRQVITRRGIAWCGDHDPVTIIGSPTWRDYEVVCDVCFDFQQAVWLYGRIATVPHAKEPSGYGLRCGSDGQWQLLTGKKQLLTGKLAIAPGSWHRVGLRFKGNQLAVLLDGRDVGALADSTYRQGLVGLGCGYEEVKFDNLTIDGLAPAVGLRPLRVTSSGD